MEVIHGSMAVSEPKTQKALSAYQPRTGRESGFSHPANCIMGGSRWRQAYWMKTKAGGLIFSTSRQLFWQQCTEAVIAAELHISQPAVNKRKRAGSCRT